jgi:hypothetical protein
MSSLEEKGIREGPLCKRGPAVHSDLAGNPHSILVTLGFKAITEPAFLFFVSLGRAAGKKHISNCTYARNHTEK